MKLPVKAGILMLEKPMTRDQAMRYGLNLFAFKGCNTLRF